MEKTIKEISDIAVATYLSVVGHKLTFLKPSGKKIIFCFENSENLESDILNFYNRTAKVDPMTFAESLRNFKGMVKHQDE